MLHLLIGGNLTGNQAFKRLFYIHLLMNTQDVFLLVKTLSAEERRIMNGMLIQYAGGKRPKSVALFEELCKLKQWETNSEQKLRGKLNLDPTKFYQNRITLGIRMLYAFPRLKDGEWNLAKMFETALHHGHLRGLTKELMDSIRKQVDQENWALAIELQELAEDFSRRHGSDKHLEGLDSMPDTLKYAEAYRLERHFRAGLKRYRKTLNQDKNQRKFTAKSLQSEFQTLVPQSNKATYLKESLMARIQILADNTSIAADLGSKLIKRLMHSKASYIEEIFDEIAFVVPFLLDEGRENEAKYFTFLLPGVEPSSRNLIARNRYLEVVNIISIANNGLNSDLNQIGFDRLVQYEEFIPKKERPLQYYVVALTFFYAGAYRECNVALNKLRTLDSTVEKVLLWQRESLALLSFLARKDFYLLERQLKVLKKVLSKAPAAFPELIYEFVESIKKAEIDQRKEIISAQIDKIASMQLGRDQLFFDLSTFLNAFHRSMSVAEYLKDHSARNQEGNQISNSN